MGITCLENIPAVGKSLHDRLFLQLVTVRKPGSPNRISYLMSSPEAVNEARKQWMDYETRPFSDFLLRQMIGYLKSTAVVESKEFELLGPETKRAVQAETSPHLELFLVRRFPRANELDLLLPSLESCCFGT